MVFLFGFTERGALLVPRLTERERGKEERPECEEPPAPGMNRCAAFCERQTPAIAGTVFEGAGSGNVIDWSFNSRLLRLLARRPGVDKPTLDSRDGL